MEINSVPAGFGFPVALLLGVSAAAGLGWSAWRAPARRMWLVMDAGLAALFGALLGGRLVFVALQWEYFRPRLAELPRFDGLSGPGALAVGTLALLMFATISRQPLAHLADALLPLAGLVSIGAWLACWPLGCACGFVGSGWWALPSPDAWGQVAPRLPLQPLAALLTLGGLVALDWSRPRLVTPGTSAALGLTGMGLLYLLVSVLRTDTSPLWLGIRVESWAALVFVGSGLLWWILLKKKEAKDRGAEFSLSSADGEI